MPFLSQAPSVELPAQWTKVRYQPTTLTGTVDDIFYTLPAYSQLLDMRVVTVQAEAGATTSTLDIEGGGALGQTTALITGASDNGGTLGLSSEKASIAAWKTSTDAINLVTMAGTAVKLNCELTFSGTATTAPIFDIWILIGKDSQ